MRRLVWGLVLGFVLSIPVLPTPVWAGVGVWTPVGGLAPFSRLLADPGDPRTLYALVWVQFSDGYALWRSSDGGDTWRSIQQGMGPVKLLAVDPMQPGRIYAWNVSDSSQPRLWVSENRGDTWTVRYAPLTNSGGPDLWQIFASPVREGVLYGWADSPTAATGADVYRSADGGATWTFRGSVGTSRSALEALLHHPTRNLPEYFDGEGFYTSHDNGLTWAVRGTFRGHGFYSVARSAAAPDRLYAIPAGGCLVRSDDGGTHWKKTRSSPALPPGDGVVCSGISVDPTDPDHVVLTAEGQLRSDYVYLFSISRDGGATWSRPRSFPAIFVLATGDDSGTLFAAGGSYPDDGPFRSTDDGLTWTPSWEGIKAGDFRGGLVALPATAPAPVLVTIVDGRILRSEDGGATWEAVALPYGYGYQAIVADADGRALYVLWRDEIRRRALVLKSTDSGLTWAEVSRVPYSFGGLLADPFHPGRLFAGDDENYGASGRIIVWRSIDGGKSWAQRSAGLPTACEHYASIDFCPGFYAMTSDPRNPDRVLTSYGGYYTENPGIFVSTDGGTHSRLAAQGPPAHTYVLAADPAVPGVFLAGTPHGIYRSVDGGDHWSPLQPGLPVDTAVVQLLRDSRNGVWYAVTASQGLFGSTVSQGIFRSTDGGTTWTSINDGLPDLTSPVVVLDPQTPEGLFAAVNGQGVWSWSPPGS